MANITFVFVTPRRWPRKTTWIAKKKLEKRWKDVRAYDASDLEQWMEQSPAAQTWFSNLEENVRSLERCWCDWATATKPELHPSLFSATTKVWYETLRSFLTKDDAGLLIITADSTEEALAFLSQGLATPELESHRDRVLVFDKTGTLPKLAQANTDFIAVIHTREVERELGPFCNSLKSILVYPRNANVKPDVILEPINSDAFSKALQAMGKSRDEINKLALASGRSLTVLRRQLASVPADGKPVWAKNSTTASKLVPLVLAGVWNTRNKTDQKILSELAGTSFETVEKNILDLLRVDDPPIWSVGEHQGVVSKIDSLFAIASSFTRTDLDRFLEIARKVLGEDDPALDLPESFRYAAPLYGKMREFSRALRESISETLVLLAVYGKDLFGTHLGFDGESEARRIVRDFLVPLTTRKLEANNNELPLYAEAAPTEFLNIIERDLRAEEPKVMGLLKPVDNALVYSCPRTGLLWALEALAWNPTTFPRVVTILGQLSEIDINDNWGNKPFESLYMIFRAWMPQTGANLELRLKAVNMLLDKHPAVGWNICLQQINPKRRTGPLHSYKPKWRTDGSEESVETLEPNPEFVKEMVKILLSRQLYTVGMLCDLVNNLHALTQDNQTRVWEIIDQWRNAGAPDEELAKLRETIRTTVLTHPGAENEWRASMTKKTRTVYEKLQPKDVICRHEWLFRQPWIDESADEIAGGMSKLRMHKEHIRKLRFEALTDIVQEQGIPGIFALSEKGETQLQIGDLLVDILTDEQIEKLLLKCLRLTEEKPCHGGIITGTLGSLDNERRKRFHTNLQNKVSEKEMLKLLLLSPYQASTWELVDQLSTEARNRYWAEVNPQYKGGSPEENNKSIRRLLEAQRPRAAFASTQYMLDEIQPPLLVEMLLAMAKSDKEENEGWQLNDCAIRNAFKLLNSNSELTLGEKAALEYAYLEVLSPPYGEKNPQAILHLERCIEELPELFVQAVAYAHKRKDNKEVPPGNREDLAKRGRQLLEAIKRIPGQEEASKEEQYDKLSRWVASVRESCASLNLLNVADEHLGNLFSKALPDKNGVWPCETVRDVMEDLKSEDVSVGAYAAASSRKFCSAG